MTLFKSEHRSPRYMSMSGELKPSRSRTASKRASSTSYGSEFDLDYDSYQEDYYDRVYDYQRVPASLPALSHEGPSLAKRSRSSSSLASGHRRSRDRAHAKSARAHSTSTTTAKLRMEELQVIKKELTLIKTQIDGLLDSLDRMDTKAGNDYRGSPLREDSPGGSPYPDSSPEHLLPPLSPPSPCHRIQRGSPELGEATDDDDHHTMSNHSSDLEDEM